MKGTINRYSTIPVLMLIRTGRGLYQATHDSFGGLKIPFRVNTASLVEEST